LNDNTYLTTTQLAERWQVNPATVLAMAKNGTVPCLRVGRAYRYPVDGVRRWERANALKAVA
jgi:excisionase family DNA binding protein